MSKKPISSAEAAADYAAKDYFIAQRSESMTTLKDEVARLNEENRNLTAKLSKTEADRDIYKRMWSQLDDKYNQLLAVTKETVKFAGLA